METNKAITREELLKRFNAAKTRKREYVDKLEKVMKAEFKQRTGQDATYFEVW